MGFLAFDSEKREIDGEKATCLSSADLPDPALSYCFSLDKPVIAATISKAESLQVLHRHPIVIQNRFVPGDLQIIREGKTILSAHIESLEMLGTINEIDFAPTADAVELPRRISISPGVAGAMIQSSSPPIYPPEAKAAGITGTVVLQAVIGVKGLVTELQVVSGPAALQQAAMDAVRNWQYRPYLLNGEPCRSQHPYQRGFHTLQVKGATSSTSNKNRGERQIVAHPYVFRRRRFRLDGQSYFFSSTSTYSALITPSSFLASAAGASAPGVVA